MGLEMLMNMFGGLGAGSLAVPNRSDGCYSHPHFSFTNLCFYLTDFIFFVFSASRAIICHPVVTTSRNGFL